MPAKQTWIVEMPEGWVPAMCPDCHIQYSGATGICGESKCPLTSAKKAVECQIDVSPKGVKSYICVLSDGIKIYAVEVEK